MAGINTKKDGKFRNELAFGDLKVVYLCLFTVVIFLVR